MSAAPPLPHWLSLIFLNVCMQYTQKKIELDEAMQIFYDIKLREAFVAMLVLVSAYIKSPSPNLVSLSREKPLL